MQLLITLFLHHLLVRKAFSSCLGYSERGRLLRTHTSEVGFTICLLNIAGLISTVERFISYAKGPITMSGGVALSKVWPKIFADVLEREVRVVESPNLSTASGAAMLASIGLNYLKAEEIESKISKVYSPDIRNNDLYRKGFSYFVSYYWRNRKDIKRINAQV